MSITVEFSENLVKTILITLSRTEKVVDRTYSYSVRLREGTGVDQRPDTLLIPSRQANLNPTLPVDKKTATCN